MNKNGFQTKVWGPPAWFFLHIIAQNFDPEKPNMKKFYKLFFTLLGEVLPCGACRDNYKRIINSKCYKLTNKVLSSRQSFSYWLFKLHNRVQKDIFQKTKVIYNKPKYEDNLNDFNKSYAFYEKFRAKCNVDKTTNYGCTVPLKGIKKKVKIQICPLGKKFTAHKSIVENNVCKI